MSAEKKRAMIELVRRSPQPKRATIAELGMARSTFYRWQRRYHDQGEAGLLDRKPEAGAVWNRLRPEEQAVVLESALQQPDLSPRELAFHVTDHAGFTIITTSTICGTVIAQPPDAAQLSHRFPPGSQQAGW